MAFAARYSTNGEQLWQFEYAHNDTIQAGEVNFATATNDGGALLTGFVRSDPLPNSNLGYVSPWVLKIDSNGNSFVPLELQSDFTEQELLINETLDLSTLNFAVLNGRACYTYQWSCDNCLEEEATMVSEEMQFAASTPGVYTIILTVSDQDGSSVSDFFDVTVSLGSGIEEINDDFSIYPNPATDFIRISSGFVGELNVSIYDVTGRLVKSTVLKDEISISSLRSGRYFVVADTPNGLRLSQFVKL